MDIQPRDPTYLTFDLEPLRTEGAFEDEAVLEDARGPSETPLVRIGGRHTRPDPAPRAQEQGLWEVVAQRAPLVRISRSHVVRTIRLTNE